MEPAPLVTLTMRGVTLDFWRRGAKHSPVRRGPVALVWKHWVIWEESEPGFRPIAALLTKASSLWKN